MVSNTSGSSHFRIGNTDVLVGIKAEIETPLAARPNSGRVQFFVDCTANATPVFEGKKPLHDLIKYTFYNCYNNNNNNNNSHCYSHILFQAEAVKI